MAAGAVGDVVLDAVTNGDMALRGRPASDAPAQVALALADRAGLDLPTRGSRPEAYGALLGSLTGVGVGVAASLLRRAGLRLPLLSEAAVIGVGAMAVTDGPMHALGVSDVGSWSAQDWLQDAVPHLAFGLAVSATLRATERRVEEQAPSSTTTDDGRGRGKQRASRGSVFARGAALGLATGARSSLGLAPLAARSGGAAAVVAASVGTEMTVDKLPSTPGRVDPAPALARVALGALGGGLVARRQGGGVLATAVVGAAGAAVGTLAGYVGREMAADRGVTWPGALVEDGVALALAAWAARG